LARIAVAMPMGRLMKKIQCQLTASVMMPPSRRPIEPPPEAMKPKTPIAFACSLGSGNMVTIMPRITAEVSAPPTPWMKRAAINHVPLWATPQSSEAAVNNARPARKTRRWPSRSPMRPASRSSPPNAIRYPLTTHARLLWEKPRSSWIVGRATLTTVPSTTIISMPVQSTYRASQRLSFVPAGEVLLATASAVIRWSPSGSDAFRHP
jgi:hypothetical protein